MSKLLYNRSRYDNFCFRYFFTLSDDEEDGEIKEIEEEKEPQPPLPDNSAPMLPPPAPVDEVQPPIPSEEEVGSAPAAVNDSLVDFILTRDADESMTVQPEVVDAQASSTPSSRTLLSRDVVEGTPLLKSASPFAKLPDGDKWAVGVSDVINFENLPDSTGKYEKMKVLIKKVQSVVRQINNE